MPCRGPTLDPDPSTGFRLDGNHLFPDTARSRITNYTFPVRWAENPILAFPNSPTRQREVLMGERKRGGSGARLPRDSFGGSRPPWLLLVACSPMGVCVKLHGCIRPSCRRSRPTRNLSTRCARSILSGPNQSLWWSLATSRRFLTGRFERTRVDAVADLIRPCECFWDVGAHQGYVALLASRRVTPSGSVYAFEPFPKNLWYLRHHVAWNRLRNITVLPIDRHPAREPSSWSSRRPSVAGA